MWSSACSSAADALLDSSVYSSRSSSPSRPLLALDSGLDSSDWPTTGGSASLSSSAESLWSSVSSCSVASARREAERAHRRHMLSVSLGKMSAPQHQSLHRSLLIFHTVKQIQLSLEALDVEQDSEDSAGMFFVSNQHQYDDAAAANIEQDNDLSDDLDLACLPTGDHDGVCCGQNDDAMLMLIEDKDMMLDNNDNSGLGAWWAGGANGGGWSDKSNWWSTGSHDWCCSDETGSCGCGSGAGQVTSAEQQTGWSTAECTVSPSVLLSSILLPHQLATTTATSA